MPYILRLFNTKEDMLLNLQISNVAFYYGTPTLISHVHTNNSIQKILLCFRDKSLVFILKMYFREIHQ